MNWPALLHLPPVLLGLPARVVVVAAVLGCFIPVAFVRPRYLSVFAIVGVIGIALLFVVLVLVPFIGRGVPIADDDSCPPLGHGPGGGTGQRALCNMDGMGLATGVVLFCFGGHACLPDLYMTLPKAQRPMWDRAVDVGFSAAGLFYALAAVLAYALWGGCVADSLTLNLMFSSPLLGSISTLAILFNTFCTMALVYVPTTRIANDALGACAHACGYGTGDDDDGI